MGTLLPFALGIAINPASIVAAILLLTSNQGAAKGLAYLAGWLLGLMTLTSGILLVMMSRGITTTQVAVWIIPLAGIILLIMAYNQWRQRPPPDAEVIPFEWMRSMPRVTSSMALGAGLFFGLFSVKNLLLTAAAAVVIREAGLELYQSITMLAIFVALATLGIAAPVYVALTQNSRAKAILIDWEYRLSIHNVTITCIVLVIIAVQLLGVGLGKLF
jgi:threonine/homoserine/homoserine lactone efflux protein